MMLCQVQTRTLPGGLACVQLGTGCRRLAIFPGLGDAAWDVAARPQTVAQQFSPLAGEHTVLVISRKRGLPQGYTTWDMANDYAAAFEQEIGPASVIGISLGSYIAQHFAADHPEYVDRLVLSCGAYRVSQPGREIPLRWLALARQNRWRTFYLDVARVTRQEFRQPLYDIFLKTLLRPRLRSKDFLVSLEACLSHDGSAALPRITARTLVIGGTADSYFPPRLLRETASRIPQATLHLIQGGGHGAYRLHQAEFVRAVLEFLGESSATAPANEDHPRTGTELAAA